MRKMYFAMIPKHSFLESAAVAVGVAAGAIYGAKMLLGEEKYNELKAQVKDKVFNTGNADFAAQGPDTGVGFGDEDTKAQEEETILERIRRAAKL